MRRFVGADGSLGPHVGPGVVRGQHEPVGLGGGVGDARAGVEAQPGGQRLGVGAGGEPHAQVGVGDGQQHGRGGGAESGRRVDAHGGVVEALQAAGAGHRVEQAAEHLLRVVDGVGETRGQVGQGGGVHQLASGWSV